MKLELTEQECNQLIQILDASLKVPNSIQLAGAVHYFYEKLKVAFEEEKAKSNDKQIKKED